MHAPNCPTQHAQTHTETHTQTHRTPQKNANRNQNKGGGSFLSQAPCVCVGVCGGVCVGVCVCVCVNGCVCAFKFVLLLCDGDFCWLCVYPGGGRGGRRGGRVAKKREEKVGSGACTTEGGIGPCQRLAPVMFSYRPPPPSMDCSSPRRDRFLLPEWPDNWSPTAPSVAFCAPWLWRASVAVHTQKPHINNRPARCQSPHPPNRPSQ